MTMIKVRAVKGATCLDHRGRRIGEKAGGELVQKTAHVWRLIKEGSLEIVDPPKKTKGDK